MADQEYFEVERLLLKKIENKRVHFLVRWKNFPPEYDTWEPAQNLTACKPLFKDFNKKKRESKSSSVAAKLLKKSKDFRKAGLTKESKEKAKKSSQVIARQKIAAQLKSKSQKLAQEGVASKSKKSEIKSEVIKKSPSKSQSPSSTGGAGSNSTKKSSTLSPSKKENESSVKSASPTGKKRTLETPKTAKSSQKKKTKPDAPRAGGAKSIDTAKGKGQVSKVDKEGVKNKSFSKVTPGKGKPAKKQDTTLGKGGKLLASARGKKSLTNGNKPSAKGGPSSQKKNISKAKAASESKPEGFLMGGHDSDISIVSDSESDSDDGDTLYSLADGIVISNGSGDNTAKHIAKKDNSAAKPSGGRTTPKKNAHSPAASPSPKKGSSSKRMSLIDFKKPKNLSGPFDELLRPSSPTPLFTPLKAVQSPLRGALPTTTALTMDSLVGDVPPAGPLSPTSISYRSLLDSLPSQLHPKGKGGKKKETSSVSGSSGQSTSSGVDRVESLERRISVRATECVFRYKQIVVKKCHRYTQIWLNTQTTLKNAFNPQVVQEVVAALNTAKYDDSTLVLFSSIGNFFCSGVDLHFLTTGDRRVAARQMADALRELTKAFITFPKPVIAGVGGSAVGLGVALLCLCDVVYSSDKAAFHLPYAQLSQTPEGCSSFTLPLALGLASANELLFGGRRITAMEAYQLGLVSHVFWPTAFMQEVIPRAQSMASRTAKVLEGTKLLVRSHHRTKMELTNETECNLLLERWASSECQRAMEAYLANENNFSS